jgi:large subunit ribosomal protein L15
MLKLGNLKPAPGSTRRRKRVGRGIGSGSGKTAGRGHKGKGSRTGGNTPPGYEGGQMPLERRVPKRGFRRLQKRAARRAELAEVNLARLEDFPEGATVDAAALRERGIIKGASKVKILGDGDLKVKLTVRADAFSKGARDKIAAAGGTAEVIEGATA